MAYVEANGLRIAYDLVGEDGSTVVFLHGVGSDRSVWREQLEAFGQNRWALAIDFRGHGESEIPSAPIDRAAFAADVSGVLNALGLAPAHLVGLSMGGMVALETYSRYPQDVLSLTLADTFARFPGWEEGVSRREADLARLSMRELAEARIPACLRPDPDPAKLRAAIDQMAHKDKRVYRESSLATWSPDYLSILPKITVPALVLWGEHDTLTPRELSEELHSGIPGSQLVMIPNAGHISNLDNPAAFNLALWEFVSRVDDTIDSILEGDLL